ncbi:MAG: hypothetical protein GY870_05530 [archaeon]|nr:hypothetical protein [archaeon]
MSERKMEKYFKTSISKDAKLINDLTNLANTFHKSGMQELGDRWIKIVQNYYTIKKLRQL